MKKLAKLLLLSSLLTFNIFLMNGKVSYASNEGEDSKFSGVIDLNNFEELEKTNEVTIKEISYDEFVKKIAKSRGISEEQVRELYPDKSKTTYNANLTSTNGYPIKLSVDDIKPTAYTMHEISIRQNVSSTYKPAVQIFAYMYFSGSFRQINYIETIDLNRGYNGISKQFSGTVKGKLLDPLKIWWYVNGDFYNNGKTTWTISGSGQLGKILTLSFSISGGSNHYKYWNNYGEYSIY